VYERLEPVAGGAVLADLEHPLDDHRPRLERREPACIDIRDHRIFEAQPGVAGAP